MFTSGSGLGFLVVGHIIGAGFAIFVFSLSVVSFPLMVDRGTDFVIALITSIRTVRANSKLMIAWGAFIGLMLLAGFLTAFIGLMIVLPILAAMRPGISTAASWCERRVRWNTAAERKNEFL